MIKVQTKPLGSLNTSQNSPNQTSKLDSKLSKKEYKLTPKSRQQINKEYYQKNRQKRNTQEKERYAKKKEQTELNTREHLGKHYEAEAIKVLMSLKEYTELNQDKRKKWLDFIWTFKDLNKVGFYDIIQIMKIREEAEKLINDYWKTAKNEIKKGKSWNVLSGEEQQRLIKYWGYEKARAENNLITTAKQLEQQSKEYLKEIERAKFHEERGKIKCSCGWCEQEAIIHKEVKKKIKKEQAEKELDDYWGGGNEKEECPECGKLKILDEESGVCKSCLEY